MVMFAAPRDEVDETKGGRMSFRSAERYRSFQSYIHDVYAFGRRKYHRICKDLRSTLRSY